MASPHRSDLAVELISDPLLGWTIDVVVSGSIAAVESVRFIRALRRLGANVVPWLTAGGARFVTEVAVGWAAGCPVRTEFSGEASHIATHHACVIAPASANILAQTALGITSTPASALVASYLGAGLPVLAVANMHESLAQAPAAVTHMETLRHWGMHFLASRDEEGKRKFPEPSVLADEVAHHLRKREWQGHPPQILVSMGTTRGYVDDVRYISNYSSGALGTAIVEELYRQGFHPTVVAGPCSVMPKTFGHLTLVETNEQMGRACQTAIAEGCKGAVLAASILDFAPSERTSGKIKSSSTEALNISLVRQPKIISKINPLGKVKVGFKLETNLTPDKALSLAEEYSQKYDLSMMVVNDLSQVDKTKHTAWLFESNTTPENEPLLVEGKVQIAKAIAQHIRSKFKAAT